MISGRAGYGYVRFELNVTDCSVLFIWRDPHLRTYKLGWGFVHSRIRKETVTLNLGRGFPVTFKSKDLLDLISSVSI
jgi:predicted heme/steroid binding protein